MNYFENTSCFNLFDNERNVRIGHNHNVWIAISNKKIVKNREKSARMKDKNAQNLNEYTRLIGTSE